MTDKLGLAPRAEGLGIGHGFAPEAGLSTQGSATRIGRHRLRLYGDLASQQGPFYHCGSRDFAANTASRSAFRSG